jgi:hypothetical protein
MTEADESRAISEKWLQYAKSAVSPYLPGLDRAEVSVSLQQFMMEGKNHRGVNLNLGRKQAQKQGPDRTVVIFRRQVRMGDHDHIH